jgi:hypothetical protein
MKKAATFAAFFISGTRNLHSFEEILQSFDALIHARSDAPQNVLHRLPAAQAQPLENRVHVRADGGFAHRAADPHRHAGQAEGGFLELSLAAFKGDEKIEVHDFSHQVGLTAAGDAKARGQQ